MRVIVDEQIILDSFRCYRGGCEFLGVKSQWWAKLIEYEEKDKIVVMRWRPTVEQLTIAEKLLFDIFLKLEEYDRKLLVLRCGTGFKRSFRKCGRDTGLHHEVFRQEFQSVILKVQKLFDEVG